MARSQPGFVDGKHFTEHVETVKALKRNGSADEAAGLLLRLIDAVEDEAISKGPTWYLAPWYYVQLAIIYRKQKLFGPEAAMLRRYLDKNRPYSKTHDPGVLARLEKAQSLEVEAARMPRRPSAP